MKLKTKIKRALDMALFEVPGVTHEWDYNKEHYNDTREKWLERFASQIEIICTVHFADNFDLKQKTMATRITWPKKVKVITNQSVVNFKEDK